ncbi:hypothetical protein LTR37_007611 [Vermiconidia calcicola]|uniref:Uncharacterized protein n=1 Tax=Vermiconidia calcicola TaxID=1690605 RepID=A0ACC3NCP1_9PEZI|nr:hypothetical protein LTR37_007611 [Vermiconidia calcicola]
MREAEEQEAIEMEERRKREADEAERAEKEEAQTKKKPKSRKSKGGDDDVDMEDADAAPKSTKKRKKDAESDAEGPKPKKTPKVTKLNAPKTPNGETSTKKSAAAKSKKKVVQAPKEDEEEEKPQMTETEKLQQREKAILYLRHRLQKGFLSRDQAPQEGEMAAMAEFFAQLEAYENLEPSIIRTTKVHKVLKAIVKLSTIPKDEQYNFKKRSAALLEIWNKRMEADGDAAPASATESKPPVDLHSADEPKEESAAPDTNGDKVAGAAGAAEPVDEDETKEGAKAEAEEKAEEEAFDKLHEKVVATSAAPAESKDGDDVPMTETVPSEGPLGDPSNAAGAA